VMPEALSSDWDMGQTCREFSCRGREEDAD
jgi:hypothetical protein